MTPHDDEQAAREAAEQIAATLGCEGDWEDAWSWEEVRSRLAGSIATAILTARQAGRAEGERVAREAWQAGAEAMRAAVVDQLGWEERQHLWLTVEEGAAAVSELASIVGSMLTPPFPPAWPAKEGA